MTVRVFLHARAVSDAVAWLPFHLETEGEPTPLGETVPSWDPSTALTVSVQATLDRTKLLASTGLLDHQVTLVLVADCDVTGRRVVDTARPTAGHTILEVRLEPGTVAGTLALSTHLVVGPGDLPAAGRHRAGSRLTEGPTHRVILDGIGGRFPTESVDFSLLPQLGRGPWAVDLRVDDPSEAVLRCVRLWLNSDHPAGRAARTTSSPHHALLTAEIGRDIVRTVLLHLAQNEDLMDAVADDLPEDSIGGTAQTWARQFFHDDLDGVLALARTDVLRFERQLQTGLDFLREELA